MKKLFRVFPMLFAFAAAMAVASCSDDDLGTKAAGDGQNEDDETTPSVYVGVNFTMPSVGQGRSFTDGENSSNDGTEVGSDAENNVGEVLLVLADTDYSYIASATVSKKDIYKHSGTGETVGNAGAYHAKARFTKTQLSMYYQNGEGTNYEKKSGKILVFVFVNPSGEIVKAMDQAQFGDINWVQTKGKVTATGVQTDGSIWTANSFLMSNASIAQREIPEEFSDWNKYSTSTHYFHLSENNDDIDNSTAGNGGPISVIRAAARMDFKDGSPSDTEPNT
ncbi:MAG: hypothetical protein K2M65_01690, partial [Muribaculaceae bacterium]|nr:hypothetical protein [Muribaculaceae bacterium]